MNTPLFNKLIQFNKSNPIPFHMPGHRLGMGLPQDFKDNMSLIDVTEISGTDNLHFPEDIILDAQNLAAKAFGSNQTFFLVNGSTSGIFGMILGTFNTGDKLIVERNCHKSVINACMIGGIEPIFVLPKIDNTFGIPLGLTIDDIKNTINQNPDAKGIILTRPNYYGICCDLKDIVTKAHDSNMTVLVDEAHGAHFCFNGKLPKSALGEGADLVVQSAHKTLPALTQTAYLHVGNNNKQIDKIKWILRSLQTSSPSYILMSSLDIAREIMETKGENLLNQLIDNVSYLKDEISNLAFKYYDYTPNPFIKDYTRIVVNTANTGYTGYEIDHILSKEYNIHIEMSDYNNIVLIPSIYSKINDFKAIIHALKNIKPKSNKNNKFYLLDHIPVPKMNYSEAINRKSSYIDLNDSVGKISAGMIVPYPPGVPVLYPGEMIDKECYKYIKELISKGACVQGISENKIRVID